MFCLLLLPGSYDSGMLTGVVKGGVALHRVNQLSSHTFPLVSSRCGLVKSPAHVTRECAHNKLSSYNKLSLRRCDSLLLHGHNYK